MPVNAREYLKTGSGIVYSMTPAKELGWKVDTNLKNLPTANPQQVVKSQEYRSGWPDYFYFNGMSKHGSFKAMVNIDPRVVRKIPHPFLLTKEHWQDQNSYKHWKILDKVDGQIGFFTELSSIPHGNYQFGLDLLLSSEAYHEFRDLSEIDRVFYSPTIRELSLKVKSVK